MPSIPNDDTVYDAIAVPYKVAAVMLSKFHLILQDKYRNKQTYIVNKFKVQLWKSSN